MARYYFSLRIVDLETKLWMYHEVTDCEDNAYDKYFKMDKTWVIGMCGWEKRRVDVKLCYTCSSGHGKIYFTNWEKKTFEIIPRR